MKNSDKNTQWRGYNFDQLVYQRALTKARIEAQKSRLTETARTVRNENPLMSIRNAHRLFSTFSFINYAVIAVKLYRRIKPIFSDK